MEWAPQIPLSFEFAPSFAAEDFLESVGNRTALAWVTRWPDWPGSALALHGPAGCGKTHLAHIWARQSRAKIVGADELARGEPRELLAESIHVAVDCWPETPVDAAIEGALFHLFNAVQERRGCFLICGRTPPARWPIALKDLRSRLAAMPAIAIDMPDDSLLALLLVKLFADRQLAAEPDVVAFLARRIERSFAAARDIVGRLDRAALAGKRAVTVALAREVLESGSRETGA